MLQQEVGGALTRGPPSLRAGSSGWVGAHPGAHPVPEPGHSQELGGEAASRSAVCFPLRTHFPY